VNALQLEVARCHASPFRFNYDAMPSLKSLLNLSNCRIKAVTLTFDPVTLNICTVLSVTYCDFDILLNDVEHSVTAQRAKCMFSEGLHWFTPERTQSKHPLNVRITFIVSLN